MGKYLIIEPGVDVLFDSTAYFTVSGTLIAHGTESDSIRFLPGDAATWKGLHFTDGDTSSLAFVRVSGVESYTGGITAYDAGTQVIIESSDITANSAVWGGGIYVSDYADVRVNRSYIGQNYAEDGGGGIHVYDGSVTVVDSYIYSNTSGQGGAVDAQGEYSNFDLLFSLIVWNEGTVFGSTILAFDNAVGSLTNCTIADNVSGVNGVIFLENAGLQVSNTILWNPNQPELISSESNVAVRYSNVEGGIPKDVSDGGGNLNVNPMFEDPSMGNFALRPNSLCIRAGDPLIPDLEGLPLDIGAYQSGNDGPNSITHESMPTALTLYNCFPNPFNPSTTIRIYVPLESEIRMTVFDAAGRQVRQLIDGSVDSGFHDVVWDGRDDAGRVVASSVYICRLTHLEGVKSIRMVLVR